MYSSSRDTLLSVTPGEFDQKINDFFLEYGRSQGGHRLRVLPVIIPHALLLAGELARPLHDGTAQFLFRDGDIVFLADFGEHQTKPHPALGNAAIFGLGFFFGCVFVGEGLALGFQFREHRLPHAVEFFLDKRRWRLELVQRVEFVEKRALEFLP